MSDPTHPRLLGDVGGTNARFAWQAHPGAPLTDIAVYPCADYPALEDAMRRYLQAHAKPTPPWCAIGIANPVTGDHVQMTNHHWSFSIEAVRTRLGFGRFVVINDFTALALALPALRDDERVQVGGGAAAADAAIGLIGPGTGLGVSGLLPAIHGGGMVPVNGEGGHVTLAGTNAAEDAVIAILRRRFGHASAERALSGPGLVNLHAAVCELDGVPAGEPSAAEITSLDDPRCRASVDLFFALLGTVAGNLALTLGARGGVFIGGGIVPRMLERFAASNFRDRFEGKGRFRAYLQQIPVFVVNAATSPALIGAARALDSL
jgi:glucokinase